MKTIDVIQDSMAMKSHTESFILWPKMWKEFDASKYPCSWTQVKLEETERVKVPDAPGVYTLLIQPGIAFHPSCSYLMYVGQAISLKNRFRNYLVDEKKQQKRPKIFYMLNTYENCIWFCFTLVSKVALNDYENELMSAFIPPKNSDNRLPAGIRPSRGAF